MWYFSPGFTLAASVDDVDGSRRTRRNPVGVSLIVTYGFCGVADDDAVLPGFNVGVGVVDVVVVVVADAVAVGSTGWLPAADNASFMLAINLYPLVSFTFMVRVKNPGEVTVSV